MGNSTENLNLVKSHLNRGENIHAHFIAEHALQTPLFLIIYISFMRDTLYYYFALSLLVYIVHCFIYVCKRQTRYFFLHMCIFFYIQHYKEDFLYVNWLLRI